MVPRLSRSMREEWFIGTANLIGRWGSGLRVSAPGRGRRGNSTPPPGNFKTLRLPRIDEDAQRQTVDVRRRPKRRYLSTRAGCALILRPNYHQGRRKWCLVELGGPATSN